MSYTRRYQNGETIEVYADITSLGPKAFSEKYFDDVNAVIIETMERAAYNLEVIYNTLQEDKYNFKRRIQYSFEKPLSRPCHNADELLMQLEKAISPFGPIPLSLQLFYKIVGSCNFTWDYETNEDIPWENADPLQITPLDTLVEEVNEKYWLEEMQEIKTNDGIAYLELSADYLHKDNISGGPAYAIEITPHPSIDGRLLNEEHETTFINYLRLVFDNCGFGRAAELEGREDFKIFRKKVRPQLRKI